MAASLWIFRGSTPRRVDRLFRRVQLVSAARFSLMHGANDAQKTMGIIAGALVTGGFLDAERQASTIPFWVILLAHTAIGLGHAVGRLAHHQDHGLADHEAAADRRLRRRNRRRVAILRRRWLGVGISTTHTITGAIVGVGATRRLSAVRWGVAGQIVWAWLLTIPASAIVGASPTSSSSLFGIV